MTTQRPRRNRNRRRPAKGKGLKRCKCGAIQTDRHRCGGTVDCVERYDPHGDYVTNEALDEAVAKWTT